jgi:hypothetical protein
MSISYDPIRPVLVRDPVTILEDKRGFAVLKSGSQISWKQWTSTSVSTTSINYSCPPPSGSVIVDRKVKHYLPMRLTFTGIPANGSTLLNPNYDAPRAFPLASIYETIQASINNQSLSFSCADVIQALLRYNTDEELKKGDYSATPTFQEQSQQYLDLYNSNRSPLSNYGDSVDETVIGRGGFPFTIVANPVSGGVNPVTAIVDVAFCENLYMSPFYFGKDNSQGFYNVNTMDFTFNFISNIANRVWSHIPSINGVANNILLSSCVFGGQIGGPTTVFAGGQVPCMFMKYITPQETQILSPQMVLTYPYFDIQRYATNLGTVNAGVTAPFTSNNIQLSSIPRRMYIYVRPTNAELYSNSQYTDTYSRINGVSIQFMNKNGLLASCNMEQLYDMSKKNHCNMSWQQWSGGPVYKPGDWTASMGTVGSILCIEFATDIGLDSLDAPGKLAQCMLQVTVSTTNISSRNMDSVLMIVPVLEGTFSIMGLGQASRNIGVLTSNDILYAQANPWVNYNDVQRVNGGDFFSGLYDFGKSVHDFVKGHKIISKGLLSPLGTVLDVVTGLPISKPLGYVGKYLGYGEGQGGVLVDNHGGQSVSRSALKRRLH